MKFTALWTLTPKYKVTFTGGEDALGTSPEFEDKKAGEVFDLPENPYTKEDYLFAGWSDGEKTYLAGSKYTMPAKDAEFVAVWEYTKYIVSFDSRGGSEVPQSKVDKNGKLIAPKQPKRNGYLFAGWYKDESCSVLWDFDIDKVSGNITLYAKWSIDAVGISSVEGASIDGNNILMVIDKEIEYVELAEKVILANSNSYWNLYYDRLGQTKIPTKIAAGRTSGTLDTAENVFYILVTTENGLQEKLYTLTIYRRFTVNVKYYDADGNSIVDEDDATLTSYKMDTYNTILSPYDKYGKEGYSFDGWDIVVDGERVPFVFGENGTNVLGSIALYAHVTPLEYTLTFTLDDDETLAESTTQTVTYDAQYTLPVPQKTGYTFKGWVDNNNRYYCDGNGVASSEWNVTQDVELTARWRINYYTVTVEKNYDGAATIYGAGQRAYGADVSLVADTNIGYTFVGWYDGDTLLTSETTYTFKVSASDRTFAAKWEINAEMQPFEFSSSKTYCTINKIKDTSATSVVIPDCVTSIGSYAFRGCTGLTEIIIPNNVRYIEDYAYSNCTGLTSVTIGSGVTSIGSSAFYNCTGLTNVTIPDSVTRIGSYAFSGCTGLTRIVIPDSVTSIGDSAFQYCYRLVEVYNKSSLTITAGSSNNGYLAYYAKNVYTTEDGSKLSTDENGYVIYTNGEERILVAYQGNETNLILPDGITAINKYAFYYCSGLTSVTIGKGVTSIGESAFSGCSLLESITIPFVGASATASNGYDQVFGYIFGYETTTSSSTVDGATYQYTYRYNYTDTFYWYYIPSSLKSVVISDGATSIPGNAFYNCTGLTSVTIGNGVTSIGDSAFQYCSGLTSITIPDSMTSIGSYAFYYCSGLTSITIPDNVTSLGHYTFSYCRVLTNVTIGNSVTYIGRETFSCCNRLTNVTIGNGVWSIAYRAFAYCSRLTSITIPNSVTRFLGLVFEGCSNLVEVKYCGTEAQWKDINKQENTFNGVHKDFHIVFMEQ